MNRTQPPAPTRNRYPWGETQGRYPVEPVCDHSTELDSPPMGPADALLSLSLIVGSLGIVAVCAFLVIAREPLAALWGDAVDVFRLWWSGVRPWVMP